MKTPLSICSHTGVYFSGKLRWSKGWWDDRASKMRLLPHADRKLGLIEIYKAPKCMHSEQHEHLSSTLRQNGLLWSLKKNKTKKTNSPASAFLRRTFWSLFFSQRTVNRNRHQSPRFLLIEVRMGWRSIYSPESEPDPYRMDEWWWEDDSYPGQSPNAELGRQRLHIWYFWSVPAHARMVWRSPAQCSWEGSKGHAGLAFYASGQKRSLSPGAGKRWPEKN